MATAPVAYENTAEARRKLKALKPLKWHRTPSGSALVAKGARGIYHLAQRSPDRRHGVFPWSLRQGSSKGSEIKIGGFDLVAQGKDFATLFDHGLCGMPPQAAGASENTPYTAYTRIVQVELRKMGSPSPEEDVTKSADYIARMEEAGVPAETTAAVISATLHHSHMHNCPEKHVEVSEAGEAKRRRGTPPIFQTLQQRLDQGPPGLGAYPTVNWPPFHIYYLNHPHGMIVEKYQSGPNAQGALNNFRLEGHREQIVKVVNVLQTDVGPRDGSTTWFVRPDDTVYRQGFEGTEAGERRSGSRVHYEDHIFRGQWFAIFESAGSWWYELEGGSGRGGFVSREAAMVAAQRALGMLSTASVAVEEHGAEETKKRLWQPDPATGLFITHSSLTRDWWLMRGDSLEGRFTSRGDAEQAAKDFSKGAASEGRRPKG